ncbi:MAG: hypothetical protein ACUVYA_20080, partial [Planctomycetota bacterium]
MGQAAILLDRARGHVSGTFRRGDVDGDGLVDVRWNVRSVTGDVRILLHYLFRLLRRKGWSGLANGRPA